MIFECNDLSQASPATVSRCGMIYLEPSSLGWRPLLKSWINTLPDNLKEFREFITGLFEWVVSPLLYFVRHNCREYAPTSDSNLVHSLMMFIEVIMEDVSDDEVRYIKTWLAAAFTFGCVWSVGASSDAPSREKFDEYFKELISGKNEEHPMPSVVGKIDNPIPTDHTVFDFMFERKGIIFCFASVCPITMI